MYYQYIMVQFQAARSPLLLSYTKMPKFFPSFKQKLNCLWKKKESIFFISISMISLSKRHTKKENLLRFGYNYQLYKTFQDNFVAITLSLNY